MERKSEVVDAFGEVEVGQTKDVAQVEQEMLAARRKELKSIPIDQLKRLLEAQGLDTGKKDEMTDRLAKHEAAGREEARAQQARLRHVLVNKKEELDGLSLPELKDRCAEEGIKGAQLSKPARIEALLKHWQAEDGVDKALAQMAHAAREQELTSLDAEALQRLCDTASVDPYVKEVMVDRIVKREHVAGRFGRPVLEWQSRETSASAAVGGDMVEALMASEANRKRERELKRQEEEAEEKKKAELTAMSLQDVKKQLAAAGQQASGKKEELVEILLQIGKQKEVAAKRKAELKAMEAAELKKYIQSKALHNSERKDEMIETILAYEAKVYESALTYSEKVEEILAERKAEWEGKSIAELKEMCASQGLANSGANKEVFRERLLEALKAGGEMDKVVATRARSARAEQLQAQSKEEVLKVCESLSLRSLVKSVVVERLLAHEDEFGRIEEPKAKRARTSKSK